MFAWHLNVFFSGTIIALKREASDYWRRLIGPKSVLLVVIVLEISQECGVIPCDARCYVTMSEIENWFSATRQKSKERERERERERKREKEIANWYVMEKADGDDPPRYGDAFRINRAKTLIDVSRLWPLTPRTACAGSCISELCYRDIDIAKSVFFPESASLTRRWPIDRPVAKSYIAEKKKAEGFVSISLRSEGWEIVFLDNLALPPRRDKMVYGWTCISVPTTESIIDKSVDAEERERERERANGNCNSINPWFDCVFDMKRTELYLFNYFKLSSTVI